MRRLVERVRLVWMSLHPRTRALTVLAPFIAQYHAMTGQDLTNRVLGDSVMLGLAAMYGALPRAAEQSAERWLAECSAAVDRAQNTNWQLNQHANDLLPEVSEAIWRRLHYLDSGGGRA